VVATRRLKDRPRPTDIRRVAGRTTSLLRGRLRDQRGFTLVELTISLSLGLVVMFGVMAVLVASLHAQSTSSNRGQTVEDIQTGVAQMTKDMREATAATSASSTALSLTMPDGRSIVYNCAVTDTSSSGTKKCTRAVNGGTAQELVRRVSNTDVFGLKCLDANGNLVTCAAGTSHLIVQLLVRAEPQCAGQGNAKAVCPRYVSTDTGYPCPWTNPTVSPCPKRIVAVRDDVELRNVS
jgi:Tfp pilus assembly protein PilW